MVGHQELWSEESEAGSSLIMGSFVTFWMSRQCSWFNFDREDKPLFQMPKSKTVKEKDKLKKKLNPHILILYQEQDV